MYIQPIENPYSIVPTQISHRTPLAMYNIIRYITHNTQKISHHRSWIYLLPGSIDEAICYGAPGDEGRAATEGFSLESGREGLTRASSPARWPPQMSKLAHN